MRSRPDYNPGTEGARMDYGYRGTPVLIDLGFDATADFHTYAIEWSPNEIRWYVDGKLIHKRSNWSPTPIPHLPMKFHLNLWPSVSRELAGKIDHKKLPAKLLLKSATVVANRMPPSSDESEEYVRESEGGIGREPICL